MVMTFGIIQFLEVTYIFNEQSFIFMVEVV